MVKDRVIYTHLFYTQVITKKKPFNTLILFNKNTKSDETLYWDSEVLSGACECLKKGIIKILN